ncbi:MAG: PSD1 and planctomycete cytochrome C domain-containing protein [Rubripirellula sp.]
MPFSSGKLGWIGAFLIANLVGIVAFSDEKPADQQPMDAAEARHFTLNVLPVLKEKCLGCHGADPDDIKGEYDVRTRESLFAGGESEEPSIVAGNPDDSPLYQAVLWEGLEMPPKENDRLSEKQTAAIQRWIKVGAPWPDDATQSEILKSEWSVAENEDGMLVTTSGGLADDWTYRRYLRDEIWAFQPLQTEFQQHSIDGFINHKLAAAEIQPASIATPQQLIRRASLDLTGLPPKPYQIKKFVKSWETDSKLAWNDLIEQLLRSKQYGERWGQHWLDVVRYADTGGFSNDYERSNAWRYRDYVIRSFNQDKAYDQFVLEQIAGDELRPDDPEAKVATGFLRMGPWDTAMIPQDEARQLYRDDVVHSVGQSFLSTPMRCCKCHDHKFDPIPTQDYYRMYSVFAATQPAEMKTEFLDSENKLGFDEGLEHASKLYDFANEKRKAIHDKQEAAAKKWYDDHELAYKDQNARKGDAEDMKPPRHVGLNETEKGRLKVREQDCWIWNRRKERYQPLIQGVFNGPDQYQNAKKLRKPAKLNEDWKPQTFIHTGGDYQAKGQEVTPGVLSGCGVTVEGSPTDDPYALTTEIVGRRLGLAKWITDKNNPLTFRSYVNRIWQYHFGTGIVRTPNNFGAKGGKPTHPELLDFLATEFVAGGMKTKALHRMIMKSDAYMRSTAHPNLEALRNKDPDNKLLARFVPRRLSAEELRDSMLMASNELQLEIGGLPMMPEINLEVALQPRMIQFSIAPAYQPSPTPKQRNRRSIYAYRVRGQADPFMEVMNLPNPNESCELRDASAVSPQAFTLMNSDVMSDRSIALALRVQKEVENLPGQIGRVFQLVFGRKPTNAERQSMRKYVTEMVSYHEGIKPEPVVYPTKVTRSLIEEFSGDRFEFEEWLPIFENYTPDAKPATVSAQTRAIADMCLLLFNSNEFVYVY